MVLPSHPPLQFLFRGSDSLELGFGLEQCTEGQADNGGGRGRREVGQWEWQGEVAQ